jgi:Arc/MetJ family transcription regulator
MENLTNKIKSSRTNIVLRDDLIKDIIKYSEAKSKREAVEKALESYSRWLKFQAFRKLRGKIKWEGDLMKMREGRA